MNKLDEDYQHTRHWLRAVRSGLADSKQRLSALGAEAPNQATAVRRCTTGLGAALTVLYLGEELSGMVERYLAKVLCALQGITDGNLLHNYVSRNDAPKVAMLLGQLADNIDGFNCEIQAFSNEQQLFFLHVSQSLKNGVEALQPSDNASVANIPVAAQCAELVQLELHADRLCSSLLALGEQAMHLALVCEVIAELEQTLPNLTFIDLPGKFEQETIVSRIGQQLSLLRRVSLSSQETRKGLRHIRTLITAVSGTD